MPTFLDPDTVAHGLQLSIAPVFLLTAVAGMIGAVSNRLARIIDRARFIEARLKSERDSEQAASDRRELVDLRTRGLLANGSIALLTLCAVGIGLTIIVLFLGETLDYQGLRLAFAGFLSGVICFLAALVCFLAETWIATRVLKFGQRR